MYTKQALEFLKIDQGFSTLVWSTLELLILNCMCEGEAILCSVSCLAASPASIYQDVLSSPPGCDHQQCLHTLLNVPGGATLLLCESHWNRQIQQQLMQTFEYNLCVFLIIYHVQYSFHFSDSSWQSFHDGSVYSHIFAVMRDGFSFNKAVVAMGEDQEQKEGREGCNGNEEQEAVWFTVSWIVRVDQKRPISRLLNPWIQRVCPN